MSHEQAALQLVVAVADDIGVDGQRVAQDPLEGKASAVHFGLNAIDCHTALQVLVQVHAAASRGCSGLNRG